MAHRAGVHRSACNNEMTLSTAIAGDQAALGVMICGCPAGRPVSDESHWPAEDHCVIKQPMIGSNSLQLLAICFTNACFMASLSALDPAKQQPLPEKPIAVKKELLFSDNFKGADRDTFT